MKTSKTTHGSPKMGISTVSNIVSLTNDRVNHQLMQMIINQQLDNPRSAALNAFMKPATAISGDHSMIHSFAA
jgi:hypothetical protein